MKQGTSGHERGTSFARTLRTDEALLVGHASPRFNRFEAELEADEQLREEVTYANIRTIRVKRRVHTHVGAGGATALENNEGGGSCPGRSRSQRWVPGCRDWDVWWPWPSGLVRPPLNERVYAEFHVPDPGLPRTHGCGPDHAFHDAMVVATKLGDHAEALMKWEDFRRRTGTGQRYAALFIGCATRGSGRAGEALSLFTPWHLP